MIGGISTLIYSYIWSYGQWHNQWRKKVLGIARFLSTQWLSFPWVVGWKQEPIPIEKFHNSQLGNDRRTRSHLVCDLVVPGACRLAHCDYGICQQVWVLAVLLVYPLHDRVRDSIQFNRSSGETISLRLILCAHALTDEEIWFRCVAARWQVFVYLSLLNHAPASSSRATFTHHLHGSDYISMPISHITRWYVKCTWTHISRRFTPCVQLENNSQTLMICSYGESTEKNKHCFPIPVNGG